MLFTIIIIVAIVFAVFLGLIVLIQNPKGGGLSGTFGGAANQIFGYKRTTDDIEKITWGLVIILFALCLSSAALKPGESQTAPNGLGPEAKPLTTSPVQPNQDDNAGTLDPTEGEGATTGGTEDPNK
ncbi:MAG: preprotein translocase subunit SecG [Chitinophagales bacterium]